MAAQDERPTLDRLTIVLGIVGTLTAIIAAISTDRRSSVIALFVIAAAAGVIRTLSVWRARGPDGSVRYPRLRGTLCLGLVFALFLTLDSLTSPASRAVIAHELLGRPDPGRDVHIVAVSIARSATAYRLETVLANRGPQKLFTHQVVLSLGIKRTRPSEPDSPFGTINGCNNGGVCTSDPTYRLLDAIKVALGGNGTARIHGAMAEVEDDGEPSEFVKRFSGSAVCDEGPHITLTLPTDFFLEPAAHTRVTIEIPRHLDVEPRPDLPTSADFVSSALVSLGDPAEPDTAYTVAEYKVTAHVGPDRVPITHETRFSASDSNPWGW